MSQALAQQQSSEACENESGAAYLKLVAGPTQYWDASLTPEEVIGEILNSVDLNTTNFKDNQGCFRCLGIGTVEASYRNVFLDRAL